MAAGEIKTDKTGNIVELSSKSGHYRPTDKENLFMLKYFKNRGVNLSNVKFTAFAGPGKTEEYNAEKYLNYLEHKAEIGELNSKIQNCKGHIARLNKQLSHCKNGKKGRVKHRSLLEQIAMNKQRLAGLEKDVKEYAPI